MNKMPQKRPPLRPKVECVPHRLEKGDYLYDLIHATPIKSATPEKRPVYKQDDYLRLLKRNYEFYGLDMKDLRLPPESVYTPSEKPVEPDIHYYDRVYVMMSVLKSGKVKVKINTGMRDMYDKYYKHNKHPPQKTVVKVYKSLGFSESFIQRIEASYKKIPERAKAFSKCIDRVFNKPSVSKPKKKKPEPEQVEENEEEEEEEDDDPGEDGEMDVEVEVDEVEEVEEVEEEYFNDD
jgi:hypothetical protein